MKIKGKKIDAPKPVLVILPRGDDEPIVLQAKAVLDWTQFDSICPTPKPVRIIKPGGEFFDNYEDSFYLAQMDVYATRRMGWLIIESLSASEDLEWELVDRLQPDTWQNYEKELREIFTQAEVNHIVSKVMEVNSMSEDRLREARERFLATLSQQGQ